MRGRRAARRGDDCALACRRSDALVTVGGHRVVDAKRRLSPMTDVEAESVLVTERRGAVAVLRLNRPEARNSLNPELLNGDRPRHGGGGERPGRPCGRADRDGRQGLLCGHGPARLRRRRDARRERRGHAGLRALHPGRHRRARGRRGQCDGGGRRIRAPAGLRRRGRVGGGEVRAPGGQAGSVRGGRRGLRQHADPAGGGAGAHVDR